MNKNKRNKTKWERLQPETDTGKQEQQEERLVTSDSNMFFSLRLSPNSSSILNRIYYHFTLLQLEEEEKLKRYVFQTVKLNIGTWKQHIQSWYLCNHDFSFSHISFTLCQILSFLEYPTLLLYTVSLRFHVFRHSLSANYLL